MTKQYVTIFVEQKKITCITCDWCHAEIPVNDSLRYGEKVIETTISCSVGRAWPNDSYGEGWRVEDLCESCMLRLNNLLKDNGINVHEYDW